MRIYKKFLSLICLVFVIGVLVFNYNAFAVIWTTDWDSSFDGSVFGGSDLEDLQSDIDTQTGTLTGTNTWTGTNTFSGTVSGIGAMKHAIVRGFELLDNARLGTHVEVTAGTLYHGDTEIDKTSNTQMTIATGANWWDGSVDTYASDGFLYIGVDVSGNVKFLGTNAPDKADTAGNTDGNHLYWFDSSKYWRVIAEVPIESGDQKIHLSGHRQRGERIMLDAPLTITTSVSENDWSSAEDCSAAIPSTSTMGIFGLKSKDSGTTTCGVWIKPNGSTWISTFDETTAASGVVAIATDDIGSGQRLCATDGSQQIQYANMTGDSATVISVEGYISNLRH